MRQRAFVYLLCVFAVLAVSCSTGERNLRSHPAVFTQPHEDFVVLVPFNTSAAAPAAPSQPSIKVASLAAMNAAPPQEQSESLTALLHDFRKSFDPAKSTAADDDPQKQLLEKIAKQYHSDVAVVRFHCVEIERDKSSLQRLGRQSARGEDRCAYVSADLRDLLAIPPGAVGARERDDVVAMLLNTSDYNCSNFLVRAFAKKTNMDSRRNTLKDIGTGLATVTASPAPILSAGLGLTNLVTGSAVDNYNASFYLEKTFQVMESAIGKERATVRQQIVKNMQKRDTSQYGFYAALNDIRAYDDACSIERGLAALSEMAAVQKDDAEKKLHGASSPGAEKERQLQALAEQLTATIQQSNNDHALVEALSKERQTVEDALRRVMAQNAARDATPAPTTEVPAPTPPQQTPPQPKK